MSEGSGAGDRREHLEVLDDRSQGEGGQELQAAEDENHANQQADEQAVVLRLGKVNATRTDPGMYFKLPFADQLTRYSKKLIEYDADPVAVVSLASHP